MTIKQACAAMLMPVDKAEVSDWIHIFPAGRTVGHDGRGPYILNNAAAVVQASKRPLVDLAVDRDHVTDLASPGTPRPAAGWIKELKAEADGIYARIEWTPPAKAQLDNREYRYISPTFLFDRAGDVKRILRASLTNDPNFEMKAVAASESDLSTLTEKTMDKLAQDLAALLGLKGDNISAEAILEAVKNLLASLEAIKAAFEVSADAVTPEAIIDAIKAKTAGEVTKEVASQLEKATAAIKKGEPDPTKYVPVGVVAELQKQVTTLTNDATQTKATAAVDTALKEGKLIPAQRDWALALASKDPSAFADYVAKAPTLIQGSGLGNYTAETAAAKGELTNDQASIAQQLGVKPDDLKAQLKQTATA
jgi:phage I-like protein